MSELPDPQEKDGVRPRFGLPPLLDRVADGAITWKKIGSVDYELLGYFLSCHLIIEHYMDEFLKANFPGLDWDAAKPTFGQRVALLNNMGLPDQLDCIPAIKHMNTLRNKLSHRIDFAIDEDALLPMFYYVKKATDGESLLKDPKELLDFFTMMCCATLAGNISRAVRKSGRAGMEETG